VDKNSKHGAKWEQGAGDAGNELDYRMTSDLADAVTYLVKRIEAQGLLEAMKLPRWAGIEGHTKLISTRIMELEPVLRRTFSGSSNLAYTARELCESDAIAQWIGGG